MPNYFHDDAICLRVTDFSETSQVVILLGEKYGIVSLLAKGAKRVSKSGASAFSGPLDLLTAGSAVFIPTKSSAAELGTLTSWQLTDHRSALRRDLKALHAAMLCAEVTLALLHPHDPHPELFAELNAALALLPTAQRRRGVVAYLKTALTAAGYAPQLEACSQCGTALGAAEGTWKFGARAAGMFCPNCRAAGGLTINVPAPVAAALARLPAPSALTVDAPERPASAAALWTAAQMLLAQVEAIVDRRLRTRNVAESIFV